VTARVHHVGTPEIVVQKVSPVLFLIAVAAAAAAASDVRIGCDGTEIVMNELTIQRIAID